MSLRRSAQVRVAIFIGSRSRTTTFQPLLFSRSIHIYTFISSTFQMRDDSSAKKNAAREIFKFYSRFYFSTHFHNFIYINDDAYIKLLGCYI